jgi:sarcosine oxidase subunit beta
MTKFYLGTLLRNALSNHERWPRQWRSTEPKAGYCVVLIDGGHWLATAYYIAKEHGIRNVAIFKKGWLGGTNTGRNTNIIRANYLWEKCEALYDYDRVRSA